MARSRRVKTPLGAVLMSWCRRVDLSAPDNKACFYLPQLLPDAPLTADERRRYGAARRPDPAVDVEDWWLEIDVADRWRAAFRLVPHLDAPVIAELRLFPRDVWPNRNVGEWRAQFLGWRASAVTGKREAVPRTHNPAGPCFATPAVFPPIRQGITGQLLRQIPVGAHVRFTRKFMKEIERKWKPRNAEIPSDEALASIGATHETWRAAFPIGYAPFPSEFTSKTTRSRATRRRGWSDRTYAKLAKAYVERIEAGSRRPVADVARRRRLSIPQVRDAIHTARERGFLTQTSKQGRIGGQLTLRARQLLGE